MRERGPDDRPVLITGAHLKRIGENAVVSLEMNGRWVDVIAERFDGCFSHIIESCGIRKCFGTGSASPLGQQPFGTERRTPAGEGLT